MEQVGKALRTIPTNRNQIFEIEHIQSESRVQHMFDHDDLTSILPG